MLLTGKPTGDPKLLIRALACMKDILSPGTRILQDPGCKEFHRALKRWSDDAFDIPAAIVFPANENDAVLIIRMSLALGVPFVPKAGGHSTWSIIGSNGIILDFGLMKNIEMDLEGGRVTSDPGVTVGEIINKVSERDHFLATGTVNSVGFIPSTVGGGLSAFSSLIGNGADNIVSARLVTSDGNVVTASKDQNQDLFYGIRGAGQYFGVILTLTVNIFPQTEFGTAPKNTIWTSTFVFPPERAAELTAVVLGLQSVPMCSVLAGVMPMAPALDPILRVAAIYIGPESEAKQVLKPLFDLGPLAIPIDSEVPYTRVNDLWAAYEGKGGYRRWWAVGFPQASQFDPSYMQYLVDLQQRLAANVPSSKASYFFIEFAGPRVERQVHPTALENGESAFSHGPVQMFAHLICYATDEEGLESASPIIEDAMAFIRQGQPQSDYTFYQNFSRKQPIEHSYRGQDRIKKLAGLKLRWDPTGVFTDRLLAQHRSH